MSNHAACSPSSANMWLACPASITKAQGLVRPSSKFAREGTAAHAVAEMSLKGDVFLPDRVEVEGEQFIVSPGMCRALNPYVSYVQGLMALPGAHIFLEHRIKVPSTYNMVWGTLDCGAYFDHKNPGLVVADLKFGRGHRVEPDAPQLKLYALGLANMVNLNDANADVTLTISQPRIDAPPIRWHATTLGALWEWSYTEVRPAIERIKAGDETEIAGSHCRWCVRQTQCKAYAGRHQKNAASAFDDQP